MPSGYNISTGEDGTKYVLNPDGSWRIFSPTEYIQEIVGVSELQKDGSRLIQTRGKYHFIISENGDIIQIPDMRTEKGWRIPEFSELKLHKRKINEYEFRGNYWLIRTNEFFYLGIRSD